VIFPITYKKTSKQCFKNGEYSIIPIRFEDRYKIMRWRNEQIDHLRQTKPLVKKEQDKYFKTIVSGLFDQENPDQLLFSFLKDGSCIGYGGLVHIDWERYTAEISFIMNTIFEKVHFVDFWLVFLNLIEQVAFKELQLRKIYTYSYEIRPKLYYVLDLANYKEEKRIKRAVEINNEWVDVRIHSKWKTELTLRKAIIGDAQCLFDWANDSETRKNSIYSQEIILENHLEWLKNKINDPNDEIYIVNEKVPVGILRIDKIDNYFRISFNVLKEHRGKGIGQRIISLAVDKFSNKRLVAEVLEGNTASQKIFDRNNFVVTQKYTKNERKIMTYVKH